VARLALISDIHGNGVALDTVLAHAAAKEVDEIVCLGDIAAGGPQPRQVLHRLRELGCRTVIGNADRWLLEGLPPGRSNGTRRLAATVAWARAQLSDDDLAFIAALPASVRCSVDGVELFCCHGSPRSDLERLLATTSDAVLDELFSRIGARVCAAGHTHLQLLRRHSDGLLVNPGSVGLPLGLSERPERLLPTAAEYALVNSRDGNLEVAFCRVSTDVDALRAASAAMPHATWASDLEQRIRRWNAKACR
jgi:putative phosphoesterase